MAAATAFRQFPAMTVGTPSRCGSGQPQEPESSTRSRDAARIPLQVTPGSPNTPSRASSLTPKSPSLVAFPSSPPSDVLSAAASSITPSQSASQSGSRPRRDSQAAAEEAARRRRISSHRRSHVPEVSKPLETSPYPLSFHNLALASLSTPALHLASEALDDDYHVDRQSPVSGLFGIPDAQSHARARSSDALHPQQSDGAFYTSLAAVMGTVVDETKRSRASAYESDDAGARRERKHSSATVRKQSIRSRDSRGAQDSEAGTISSAGTISALGPAKAAAAAANLAGASASARSAESSSRAVKAAPAGKSSTSGSTKDKDVKRRSVGGNEGASMRNPSTWFRRQRRWSATSAASPELDSDADSSLAWNGASSSSARSPGAGSDVASAVSAASAGSGTTLFNESHVTAQSESSLGVDAPAPGPLGAQENLRNARAFMVSQLAQLTPQQMGSDRNRIASLAWYTREQDAEARGVSVDVSREILEFWMSISDGVLLCVLANKIRPGSVDRIDRRDVEWVKADNISRFLRAARDHFGVRSKDLFHPLDLTDATSDGLNRTVHTILSLQHEARLRGFIVPAVSSSMSSEHSADARPMRPERRSSSSTSNRASMQTPPLTPDNSAETLSGIAVPFPRGNEAESSPAGSPAKRDLVSSGPALAAATPVKAPRKIPLSVQQQRQEAERKLVAAAATPPPLAVEPQVKARRRRSSDASGSLLTATRPKGASITFAENISSRSGDEEGRMPYRDRKLSESALSLTGVVEEEGEEVLATPVSPRTKVFNISLQSTEELDYQYQSEEHTPARSRSPPQGARGGATPSPMARSSSQRRISQELGLSVVSSGSPGPRTPRASSDFEDYRFPGQGSPSRQGPVRRHSARSSYAGPSSLNPQRDTAAASSNEALIVAGSSPGAATPKVPFPRTAGSAVSESPSTAKRASRHLSLNAGSSLPADAASALSGHSAQTTSPKLGAPRPAYRHMRYSSELHISKGPSGHAGARSDASADERSMVGSTVTSMTGFSRSRYDSEAGSLYANTLGSFTNDDFGSSVARSAAKDGGRVSKHKLVVVEDGKPNVTFQMGNCIGRGQFGSVYRALNLNTGQMVAVKRIKLEGRSEDEVTQLMNEVDLLKSLAHPSVVKYEGLVRGPDVLSIILEYVENGSLLHTLKAFGNFPEKLVASYVVKILEGLGYLHEMKVVHCDLKAANILTTKNGNVKLSDFGVSLNLKAVEAIQSVKNDAIGTPNWMAPEVIQLQGASTAADIWSLGCTIIELLTGKPPYGDMLAMSAMWRIVEDDRPPIPDKCSDSLRDFLILCFNKDPTKRPSAEELFEHQWLANTFTGHKQIRPQDSVPFLKRISADFRKVDLKSLHAAVEAVAEQAEPVSPSPSPFKAESGSLNVPRRPGEVTRSTSSPPGMLEMPRPLLGEMRAASTPDPWSQQEAGRRAMMESVDNVSVLTRDADMTRRGSEGGISPIALGMLRSPSMAASSSGERSQAHDNPSLLDLDAINSSSTSEGLSPVEHPAKAHAFVKSTFSKAVQCKICREPVKKHAVLCEECGLICHASCARRAMAPCDLRAQLLMLSNQHTHNPLPTLPSMATVASRGKGSSSSHLEAPSPTTPGPHSPSFAPVFRLPFGKARRLSKQSMERPQSPPITPVSANPISRTSSPTPVPPPKDDGSAAQKQRRRRISLLPRRSPSPLPPVAAAAPSISRSLSSSNSIADRARRASSFGYGSISGSSSISSASNGGGSLLGKSPANCASPTSMDASPTPVTRTTGGGGGANKGHRSVSSAAISTPHLALNESADSAAAQRAKYRQSAGLPYGASEACLTDQQKLDFPRSQTMSSQPEAGGVTPRARDRRSRRVSTKGDCTIM